MECARRRLLFWAWLIGGVHAVLTSPSHLYPLTRASITYDVITKSEQRSALPEPCPLLVQSDDFQSPVFFFDGSPRSIVTFNLNGSEPHRSGQLSFAFWIRPDVLDGVFFEYCSNVTGNGTIQFVKGELQSGRVKMSWRDLNGVMFSMTSSHTLSEGDFKTVVIVVSQEESRIKVDNHNWEKQVHNTTVGFRYPGALRIGESWEGGSFFLGQLCCAAVYLYALESLQSYQQHCENVSKVYPLDSGVPQCSAFNAKEDRELVHLWPLVDTSLTYDVMTLTPSQHPGNWSQCPDFEEDHKKFDYPTWKMDGSRRQTLELGVSGEVYGFAIALYLWTYRENSVLMEYTADSASSHTDFTKFFVRLDERLVHVEFQNSANATLLNVTFEKSYGLESWKFLGLQWHYGLGKLTVVEDDTEAQVPAPPRRRLVTPGVLTVGGTDSGHWGARWPRPFLGLATCLAFYGHAHGDLKSMHETVCKVTPWPNTPNVTTCLARKTGDFGPPVHCWPLTNATLAYDVAGNYDAFTPTLSTFWKCPVFGQGKFSYPAIDFTTMNPPDVILRIPSANHYVSFTLGMFVKPAGYQGVLLEYVMDDDVAVSGDVISYLKLEVTSDKHLSVNLTCQDGTQVGSLQGGHDLKTGEFKHIRLAWDLALGLRLGVQDGEDKLEGDSIHPVPLGTPGKLRVAARNPLRGGLTFQGFITCLAFFSRYISKDSWKGEFESYCGRVLTNVSAKFDTTRCTDHPPCPVNIWPLNNVTLAVEALSGTPPLSSPSLPTCRRLEASGSTLTGPRHRQLYFDGSLSSAVDLPVNRSLFEEDFALVVFFKPQPPAEGDILDYRAPSTNITHPGISRIRVSLDSASSSLQVSVWQGSHPEAGAAVCSHFSMGHVPHSSWSMLKIESFQGKLDVALNQTVRRTGHVCPSGQHAHEDSSYHQGHLSLGGRPASGRAGYRGAVGCVMLFSAAMGAPDFAMFLRQCQKCNPSFTAGREPCSQNTTQRDRGFQLVSKDVQPSHLVPLPIRTFLTNTKADCAKECTLTHPCRAFVIKASMTSKHSCLLYDYVTTVALESRPGSKYYEIKY